MSLDAVPGGLGLVGALAVGVVQWLASRTVRELDESRTKQGERIGKLEAQAHALELQLAEMRRDGHHSAYRLDEIAGSIQELSVKMTWMAEKIAGMRATAPGQSTSTMPAVVVPRPRPSRPDR